MTTSVMLCFAKRKEMRRRVPVASAVFLAFLLLAKLDLAHADNADSINRVERKNERFPASAQAQAAIGTNLALGKPVIASGPTWGLFTPVLLTDGNPQTFCHPA